MNTNILIQKLDLVENDVYGSTYHIQYTDNNQNTALLNIKKTPETTQQVNQLINGEITDAEFITNITNDYETHAKAVTDELSVTLARISDHITTDGQHVFFDGDEFGTIQLDPTLETHIVRLMSERATNPNAQREWKAFARFSERLYQNVDPSIRADFVKWLEVQDWLTFTDDGRLVGYRGCQANPITGEPESIHSGPAVVDNQTVMGHVPNPVGSVVEMQRSKVTADSSVGCSSGLHVGTYDYALNWGTDYLLRVAVAPEDIVSVPYDCNAQKIRCCRFEVLEATPKSEIMSDTDTYEDKYHEFAYFDDDIDEYDDDIDNYDDYDEYDDYDDEYDDDIEDDDEEEYDEANVEARAMMGELDEDNDDTCDCCGGYNTKCDCDHASDDNEYQGYSPMWFRFD